MAKSSGQKFIGRNRAPRVQIEYDVEVYGAEKTVQLPFVVGVLSDLSGKPEEPLPGVENRKFLEIDVDNFDDRLKAMKPRVAFPVANSLTGEGNLMVDLTFENMDDFSPAAIAQKVEPLRRLLETRSQLANLMTWMDGKSGAEDLISDLLKDRSKLQSFVAAPAPPSPAPAAPVSPPPAPAAQAPAAPAAAPAAEPPAGGEDLDDLLKSIGGDSN
ncbi:MAG: type VI secretion system contractile sheath small subunit [Lacipirellulaceae bacterium]